MHKLFLLVMLFVGVGLIFTKVINTQTEAHPSEAKNADSEPSVIPGTKQTKPVIHLSESVFVPYWNLNNMSALSEYDSVIYFGISVDENGVNRSDQGFTNMQTFVEGIPDTKKYLTVRMLNTETNLAILENKEAQKKVISDVISVVKEYEFDGIVLDLELSVLPFTDIKENISMFTSLFSKETKAQELDFLVALYGDTYYRSRPYDVKKIADEADQILIMAYDFHKSRGEPGPNFPFSGQKTYGYDFQQMIHDFSQDVPTEKLTVIFGKFGYDWPLGSEGKPLTGATAFSLANAEKVFISSCDYAECSVSRDSVSKEMNVKYKDEEGYEHSAWFEDEESIEIKTEYLKEQGIGNVSYWVWGYW